MMFLGINLDVRHLIIAQLLFLCSDGDGNLFFPDNFIHVPAFFFFFFLSVLLVSSLRLVLHAPSTA